MITKREIRDVRVQLLVTPSKMTVAKALAKAAGVSVNELFNIALDRLIAQESAHDTPVFRSILADVQADQTSHEHQLSVEEVIKDS